MLARCRERLLECCCKSTADKEKQDEILVEKSRDATKAIANTLVNTKGVLPRLYQQVNPSSPLTPDDTPIVTPLPRPASPSQRESQRMEAKATLKKLAKTFWDCALSGFQISVLAQDPRDVDPPCLPAVFKLTKSLDILVAIEPIPGHQEIALYELTAVDRISKGLGGWQRLVEANILVMAQQCVTLRFESGYSPDILCEAKDPSPRASTPFSSARRRKRQDRSPGNKLPKLKKAVASPYGRCLLRLVLADSTQQEHFYTALSILRILAQQIGSRSPGGGRKRNPGADRMRDPDDKGPSDASSEATIGNTASQDDLSQEGAQPVEVSEVDSSSSAAIEGGLDYWTRNGTSRRKLITLESTDFPTTINSFDVAVDHHDRISKRNSPSNPPRALVPFV